jgi:hypothetical protein
MEIALKSVRNIAFELARDAAIKRISHMDYELYGLTESEIRIVEETTV